MKGCGPKGYPGMPESGNMGLPPKLLRQGITDMVRISDARMSGTAYGTVILHVAPESAAGGPLALVRDGDLIELDVAARRLELLVDAAELARAAPHGRRRLRRARPAMSGCSTTMSPRPTRAATSTSWSASAPASCIAARTERDQNREETTRMQHLLGIDVGGTFTDFVAYDRGRGGIEVWKELSVPADPVAGILAGLERYPAADAIEQHPARHHGRDQRRARAQGRRRRLRHHQGLQDVPFIQRGNRKSHYDMSWVKPKPLVKRRHCFELDRAHRRLWRRRHRRSTRPRCARVAAAIRGRARDRGGRRLPAVLLPQPGARAARSRRSWPRSCRACRSRSPTRCCRSGRSTSAPRPRSPTPISSRSSAGSCARCASGSTRRASGAAPWSSSPTAAR